MKTSQKNTVCYVRIGEQTLTIKGVFEPEQMAESGRMIAAHVAKIMASDNLKMEVIGLIVAIEKNYEVLSKDREITQLKKENDRWKSLFDTTVKNLLDIQASSKRVLVDPRRQE
jgi:hypothetical protein